MLADTPTATANVTALTGEQYSSTHRVGCVAELQGYHFNLKELNLPIDPLDRANSPVYELEF